MVIYGYDDDINDVLIQFKDRKVAIPCISCHTPCAILHGWYQQCRNPSCNLHGRTIFESYSKWNPKTNTNEKRWRKRRYLTPEGMVYH